MQPSSRLIRLFFVIVRRSFDRSVHPSPVQVIDYYKQKGVVKNVEADKAANAVTREIQTALA